jgi:peptide methionine sulfoxide reductase msrA/msrB
MEYYFSKTIGVVDCEVGYMGGKTKNPTYKEVCAGGSEHYEVTEVTYDPKKTNFENIARVFFEIHDPTQTNGQGPDIGEQYLSVAFYASEEEKQTLLKLIAILEKKGFDVATGLLPLSPFWKAEDYHQEYYQKNGKEPYCHGYVKRF